MKLWINIVDQVVLMIDVHENLSLSNKGIWRTLGDFGMHESILFIYTDLVQPETRLLGLNAIDFLFFTPT